MQDGALHHSLETGGGRRINTGIGLQRLQFGIEIADQLALQFLQIDIAGLHHLGGVGIGGQRQQEMFERGIFVGAARGFGQRVVQGLFEFAGERGHQHLRGAPFGGKERRWLARPYGEPSANVCPVRPDIKGQTAQCHTFVMSQRLFTASGQPGCSGP